MAKALKTEYLPTTIRTTSIFFLSNDVILQSTRIKFWTAFKTDFSRYWIDTKMTSWKKLLGVKFPTVYSYIEISGIKCLNYHHFQKAQNPTNKYLSRFNDLSYRKRCEIELGVNDVILVPLLLTLNIFHTFF